MSNARHHTLECLAQQRTVLKAELSYRHEWNNYCQVCNGWGYETVVENTAPKNSGLYWPTSITTPCPACLGHQPSTCPRCSAAYTNTGRPCTHCGWRPGTPGIVQWNQFCGCHVDQDKEWEAYETDSSSRT